MSAEPLDTPLARLLLARGRLPLETLRGALDEVRALRGQRPDDRSLAETLVGRGLLDGAEARALLAESTGAVAWQPGSLIAGRYRVERRLGQGGMGAVDEVTDLTTGGRRALKSLAAASDAALLLRFKREGEALARVDRHPNVVRVHAAGQDQGRLWLLMDLEAGGDLARRADHGPLAVEEVVRLGVDLAGGLAHVHRHGVLHRDLKPQNVLFDAEGTPKLTDFGLARTADARSLTQTGELLGTPAYMAPEQATGDVAAQDERTDVYGLGAVLYHALTGRPPHQGASPLAVLQQVLEAAPAAPRRLRAGCPAWLEAVVLRALARRPADRFPSAAALRDALLDAGRTRTARARRAAAGAALVTLAGVVIVGAAARRAGHADGVATASSARAPAPRPREGAPRAPAAPAPATPVTAEEALARARGAAALPDEPPAWLGPAGLDARGLASTAWTHAARGGEASTEVRYLAQYLLFDHADAAAPAAGVAWLARLIDAPWAGVERSRAWFLLGRAFRDGRGIARDDRAALACFERGAALGDLASLETLARARDLGLLLQAPDPAGAFDLAERALAGSSVPDDAGCWLSCAALQARLLLERPELRTPERLERLRARLDTAERLELAPRHPRVWLARAWLAEVDGHETEATTAYGRVAGADDPAARADALLRWLVLARRRRLDPTRPERRLRELAGTSSAHRPAARALGLAALESGDGAEAARWLLVAAAPGDAAAAGETELRARLELGRLARQELDAGRAFPDVSPVVVGLRRVADLASLEAADLAAWLEARDPAGAAGRDLLRRVEDQVGPPALEAPTWLPPEFRADWPRPDAAPSAATLVLAEVLSFEGLARERERESWEVGLPLFVRIARAAPLPRVRGRAWAKLARALREGRGLARDEAQALACYRFGVTLGSLTASEDLARAHLQGALGLAADPARAFALADAALGQTPFTDCDDVGAWVACAHTQTEALTALAALRTHEHLARVRERLRTAAARANGERLRRLEAALEAVERLEPEAPSSPRALTPEQALAKARAVAPRPGAAPPDWLRLAPDGPDAWVTGAWRDAAARDPATDDALIAEFLLFNHRRHDLHEDAPVVGVGWLVRLIDGDRVEPPTAARAWTSLGRAFRMGRGVAVDERAAIACFERAAPLGSLYAQDQLARASAHGTLGQRVDLARAFDLTARAVDEHARDDIGCWLSCAELQAWLLLVEPRLRTPERLATARERLATLERVEEPGRLPRVLLGLAWLAELDGRLDDAVRRLRQVVETTRERDDRAAALLRLSLLAPADGSALPHLERLARESDDRAAAYALGEAHRSRGLVGDAAAWLLVAATPGAPAASTEAETRAALALGDLVRAELEAGWVAPTPTGPVLELLRALPTPDAADLAGRLDALLAAHRRAAEEALRALDDAVRPLAAPLDGPAPDWLTDGQRANWWAARALDDGGFLLVNALREGALREGPVAPQRDPAAATATALLLRLARGGSAAATRARARAALGATLARGIGVPPDTTRGLLVLEQALALGSPTARELLGAAYLHGELGRPADPPRAFAVMEPAMAAHALGDNELADAFVTGCQVQADALTADERLRTPARVALVRSRLTRALALVGGTREANLRAALARLDALTPGR